VEASAQGVSWTEVVGVLILAAQLLIPVGVAFFACRQLSSPEELREVQTRAFVVLDPQPPFFDLSAPDREAPEQQANQPKALGRSPARLRFVHILTQEQIAAVMRFRDDRPVRCA
jgi:hypothetical protein